MGENTTPIEKVGEVDNRRKSPYPVRQTNDIQEETKHELLRK